jgi:hypothetical protein
MRLHDLIYTFSGGNTWLIGDNNDDGLLDDDDVAIDVRRHPQLHPG